MEVLIGIVSTIALYFLFKFVYYTKEYASYCTECDELNSMIHQKEILQKCSYCHATYRATEIEIFIIPRKSFRKYQWKIGRVNFDESNQLNLNKK